MGYPHDSTQTQIYKEQGLYNDKIREGLLEVIIRNKEKYPDLFKK